MSNPQPLQNLIVSGPGWEADVSVIDLGTPIGHSTLRTIFVERSPRILTDDRQFLAPGVQILLGIAHNVRVGLDEINGPTLAWERTGAAGNVSLTNAASIQTALDANQICLLLVQGDPERWPHILEGETAQVTCLAGEIALDWVGMQGNDAAAENLYQTLALTRPASADPDPRTRPGNAQLASNITVHSSGLSLYGRMSLPWAATTIAGVFQLTQDLSDPPAVLPYRRMTLERERLTIAETELLIEAWRTLSQIINPAYPLNREPKNMPAPPQWVTLEMTDLDTPPLLTWLIDTWPPSRSVLPVVLQPGAAHVVLSDQPLYDQERRPTAVGRIVPEQLLVIPTTHGFDIRLGQPAPTAQLLRYTATLPDQAPRWNEQYEAQQLTLAYNPTETASLLRRSQNIPEPIYVNRAIDPAILWGWIPLADGWAQLPVFNLSEQTYVDAGKVPILPAATEAALRGATVYAASTARASDGTPPNDVPWSLTLTDVGTLHGRWFARQTTSGYALSDIALDLFDPEITLRGILWLSTATATLADALPDLDNWIGGLAAVQLHSIDPSRTLFAAPLVFDLSNLRFTPGDTGASLGPWSLIYRADPLAIQHLSAPPRSLLNPAVLQAQQALIWRRHPTLPMIQALPLTQNQQPPNAPSASRQLMPYELPIRDGLPDHWTLGVQSISGTSTWPTILSPVSPAHELASLHHLPLAALSLPGLFLDPAGAALAAAPLSAGYRLDLPYTDQVHALADLPPPRPERLLAELQSADPPDAQPMPLDRETYAAHWSHLAELAALAQLDSVEALQATSHGHVINGLVEPFSWPVQPTLAAESYPGTLALRDTTTGTTISLSGTAALEGLSGSFTNQGGSLQLGHAGTPQAYQVTAGSMAAALAQGLLRDQRGLYRSASTPGTRLLKTEVVLEQQSGQHLYWLTSTRQPLQLAISTSQNWQIWFRDLPVAASANGTSSFERALTHSPLAQDVNDPAAIGADYNVLSGYEWRLSTVGAIPTTNPTAPATNPTAVAPLLIHGLWAFPLTLERVVTQGDQVHELALIVRLQLPLPGRSELEQYSNAVRLLFRIPQGQPDGQLRLSEIALADPTSKIDWLLADETELIPEPARIRWNAISLTDGIIRISDPVLRFGLFNTPWEVKLNDLEFAQQPTTAIILHNQPMTPTGPLGIASVFGLLDLVHYAHQAHVDIAIRLERRNTGGSMFAASVRRILHGTEQHDRIIQATLFDDLTLNIAELNDQRFTLGDHAFQCAWQTASQTEVVPSLLPGMPLQLPDAPGCVALTYHVNPQDATLPEIELESAFTEALLQSRWGSFIHDRLSLDAQLPAADLTASSAGDLLLNYTATWRDHTWNEAVVLNGMLEIGNLISWPQALQYDATHGTLTTPAARPGGPLPPLEQSRHRLRILFNQHMLDQQLLVPGADALLFHLNTTQPWQFLAVVEHALIDAVADAHALNQVRLINTRRWTVIQEVRCMPRAGMQRAIIAAGDPQHTTIDPINLVTTLGNALDGMAQSELNTLLINAINQLPDDMLFVEASAPLWVGEQPITHVRPTRLQYLPSAVHMAHLSNPNDYAPSEWQRARSLRATESQLAQRWLLLTMPFLGRLQPADRDQPTANPNPLQSDPISILAVQRQAAAAIAPLTLVLTGWADRQPLTLHYSATDSAVARRWARLDPRTLEENWFRIQTPPIEELPANLPGISSAFPDTPARLSRSAALKRAFDIFRPLYPPARTPQYALPSEISAADLIWRPDARLVLQSVSDLPEGIQADASYGWLAVGLLLRSSGLGGSITHTLHPAVTLLPAWLNTQAQRIDGQNSAVQANPAPLSYAISPYLQLEYVPVAQENLQTQIAIHEILALDPAGRSVRPVATRIVERAQHPNARDPDTVPTPWHTDTLTALAPESAIGLVRTRTIRSSSREQVDLIAVGYRFSIAKTHPIVVRSRPAAPLRTIKEWLRSREGQYGGAILPRTTHDLELAPPQVIGVQPLYLTRRPPTEDAEAPHWPWGLSAIRVSLRSTANGEGIVGGPLPATSEHPQPIWWQTIQQRIQYRSGQHGRPSAGLPAWFRAAAASTLLPAAPNPILPALPEDLFAQPLGTSPFYVSRWQPVLPGEVRYLATGLRAGAAYAMRHQIIGQDLNQTLVRTPTPASFVSGSIPIQHRAPRPVPLPPIAQQSRTSATYDRTRAMRSWASFFRPAQLLQLEPHPTDEAFFGASPTAANRRIRLTMISPAYGLLPVEWVRGSSDQAAQRAAARPQIDGIPRQVRFRVETDSEGSVPTNWEIALALVSGTQRVAADLPVTIDAQGNRIFSFSPNNADRLAQLVQNLIPGSLLAFEARVTDRDHGENLFQILRFEVRVLGAERTPLPLAPRYITFEDPEYNRRLSSQAAQAARQILLTRPQKMVGEAFNITMAVDRREYNPDSKLLFIYDWVPAPNTPEGIANSAKQAQARNVQIDSAKLRLYQIADGGIAQLLTSTSITVELGKITPIDLGDIQSAAKIALTPSDTLLIELDLNKTTPLDDRLKVFLSVNITDQPIIPAPEAGYALLRRWRSIGRDETECVRFAWAPTASRIELIAASDLLQGMVRRRAVFQWRDTVRLGIARYTIQKIAANGSTFVPEGDDWRLIS